MANWRPQMQNPESAVEVANVERISMGRSESQPMFCAAVERMTPRQAWHVFQDYWEEEREAADRATLPVDEWTEVSPQRAKQVATPPNRVRYFTVVSLLRPGDRLLDVGCADGLLMGLALKSDSSVQARGIEPDPRLVRKGNQCLANHSGGRDLVVEGSIYDPSPSDLEGYRPTLVTVTEVLEHLEDPQEALKNLGREYVDDQTRLLITVPLRGRLEGVWGHLSIFDIHRVAALAEGAGLKLDAMRPVANTWLFATLSSNACSSPGYRSKEGEGTATLHEGSQGIQPKGSEAYFNDLSGQALLEGLIVENGVRRMEEEREIYLYRADSEEPGVTRSSAPVSITMSMKVDTFCVLRLAFRLKGWSELKEVGLRIWDESGGLVHGWSSRGGGFGADLEKKRVLVFRPGLNTSDFVYSGRRPASEDGMQLTLEVEGRSEAVPYVAVSRVGWIKTDCALASESHIWRGPGF